MKAVLPMMAAAPALLAALRSAFRSLDSISDTLHYEDGASVTFLESHEIEELYYEAISELASIKTIIVKATPYLEGKGCSPIALANAATPFWFRTIHNYDGLELAPVAQYRDKKGCKFCERVDDPQDAQFWSCL